MCVRPGRPKSAYCKRGHARIRGQKRCVLCRRYRDRLKYQTNADFKRRKIEYQRQWRKDFFVENGYWASKLYDRKPVKRLPRAGVTQGQQS